MKARPRNAENRIAEELTLALGPHVLGDFVFERIPVIGRRGPDLTYPNPLDLAIDVKTRLSVPKGLFKQFPISEPDWDSHCVVVADFFVCRVHAIKYSLLSGRWACTDWRSEQVWNWYRNMARWTVTNPSIPALILHRPRMKYRDSVFICHRLTRHDLAMKVIWAERRQLGA